LPSLRGHKGGGLFIRLSKKVVPRTVESLFQSYRRIDGGILAARLDGLKEPATEIGFLSQPLLRQPGVGAEAANILAKNNIRGPLHRSNHAGGGKVESDLQIAFFIENLFLRARFDYPVFLSGVICACVSDNKLKT
jgi:hypothetical protein